MRLRERLFRRGPRCPYCRDPLGSDAAARPCTGCGVQLHAACMGELGRCPTIGCSSAAVLAPTEADLAPTEAVGAAEARRVVALFGGDSPRAVAVALGVIVGLLAALTLREPRLWPFTAGIVATAVGCVALAALMTTVMDVVLRVATRVLVQPARPRPGARLRVTVECSRALLRRLRDDPSTIVRAELTCTRPRGRVPIWHEVRLGRVAPGAARATFDFEPPVSLKEETEGVWRLDLVVYQQATRALSESFRLEAG